MWQYLVDRTNEHAQKITSRVQSTHSLYRNWKPVTIEDKKAFIAIIRNMGIIQIENLKDYWATDDASN